MKKTSDLIKWKKAFIKELVASLDAGVSVNGSSEPCREGRKGVLKVSSVSYGVFNPLENKEILLEELPRAKETPQEDRIIISRSSGSKDLVGANVYISKNYEYLFLSDKLWQLKPKKNLSFSMKWLFYYLNTPRIKSLMKDLSTGSSTMHNLSKEDFLNFPVDIPPLPEQIKIAQILSTWDKAITQTQQLIEAKQRLKQGLMHQLLTGRMRFKEFGMPVGIAGGIPEGWKKIRLDKIFKPVKQKNKSGCKRVLTASGQLGLVDQQEYFNRDVSGADLEKYYLIHNGEFAYNRSSMKTYPYGAIKRLDRYEQGIVSTLYLCFSTQSLYLQGYDVRNRRIEKAFKVRYV